MSTVYEVFFCDPELRPAASEIEPLIRLAATCAQEHKEFNETFQLLERTAVEAGRERSDFWAIVSISAACSMMNTSALELPDSLPDEGLLSARRKVQALRAMRSWASSFEIEKTLAHQLWLIKQSYAAGQPISFEVVQARVQAVLQ